MKLSLRTTKMPIATRMSLIEKHAGMSGAEWVDLTFAEWAGRIERGNAKRQS